jgi:uncharacterized protein YecT (DUF1311 family)
MRRLSIWSVIVGLAIFAPAACTADEGDDADAQLTSAYKNCLDTFPPKQKEKLRAAQRAWITFSNKDEAAAELAGRRRGLSTEDLDREGISEVIARTNQLKRYLAPPPGDLQSCKRDLQRAEQDLMTVYQQSLQSLALDEQPKLREAQRSWIEYRDKDARARISDPTGRAPVWAAVLLARRRAEELQIFYLDRLAHATEVASANSQALASPSTSLDRPTPTPESSPTPISVVMDCAAGEDESAKSDTLHFKDFYLGMPLGCAAKLISEKYSAAFGEIKIEDSSAKSALGMSNDEFMALAELAGARKTKQKVAYVIVAKGGSLLPAPVIEADAQKKVIAFHFSGVLVDGLFNTSDMKVQDFAQQFANSYNIPEMNYFMRERPLEAGHYDQGWEYTSPKGFYVKIDENKGLVVESVPASSERKFD